MEELFKLLKDSPSNVVLASIAVSLDSINKALNDLILVQSGKSTFREIPDEEPLPEKQGAPEKTETPAVSDVPWEETKPESAEEAARTHEDIRGLLRQCTAKGIPDRGKALLKNRGCSKVSDLKAEDIDSVYAELTELLGEAS